MYIQVTNNYYNIDDKIRTLVQYQFNLDIETHNACFQFEFEKLKLNNLLLF